MFKSKPFDISYQKVGIKTIYILPDWQRSKCLNVVGKGGMDFVIGAEL